MVLAAHGRSLGVVTLLALASCSADEALRAGVNTALAVGATAVNREATGDCWGSCAFGTHCNHTSGLCVDDNETDPAAPPQPALAAAPVPALAPSQEVVGSLTCEATGGACVDEGMTCTIAHDECVGQCRCLGLTWQCLESCR